MSIRLVGAALPLEASIKSMCIVKVYEHNTNLNIMTATVYLLRTHGLIEALSV